MSSAEQFNNSASSNQSGPRYHIRKNNQGQNQLHMPVYYEEQGDSSSLQYAKQENRILKDRIKHLQHHLEDALNQFKNLEALYRKSQTHEKQLLAKVNELGIKMKALKDSLAQKQRSYEELVGDYQRSQKKFQQLQKTLKRCKQNQNQLLERIGELQAENEDLRRKATQRDLHKSRNGQNQNERVTSQLRLTIEQLQLELSKKDGGIRQLTKESNKYKNQLKELRDQLEELNQNNLSLKKKLEKLERDHKQNQKQKNEYKNQKEGLEEQVDQLRRQMIKLKRKEKQYQEPQQLFSDVKNNEEQQKYRKTIKKLQEKNHELEEQVQNLQKQAKARRTRNFDQKNNQEVQNLENQNKSLKRKIQNLQKQIADLERQLLEQRTKKVQLKDETIQKSQKVQRNQDKIERDNSIGHQIIQRIQKQLLDKQRNIGQLQQQLILKNDQINGLKIQMGQLQTSLRSTKINNQNVTKLRRNSDQDDLRTSEMLQMEYNNELQALRRLILYKKYSNEESMAQNNELRVSRIRRDYEQKITELLSDFKILQAELQKLRVELIQKDTQISRQTQFNGTKDVMQVQREAILRQEISILLMKLQRYEQQRFVYVQSIGKWEIAYEDLKKLYQQKLISKDHHINLLKLKLGDYRL